MIQYEIQEYVTPYGKNPFRKWLKSLKDWSVEARIRERIDRLERGHIWDYKPLGAGLLELRLSFGPGYRVYLGIYGKRIVLLLCGGDKSSQRRDIIKATQYWNNYRRDHA